MTAARLALVVWFGSMTWSVIYLRRPAWEWLLAEARWWAEQPDGTLLDEQEAAG